MGLWSRSNASNSIFRVLSLLLGMAGAAATDGLHCSTLATPQPTPPFMPTHPPVLLTFHPLSLSLTASHSYLCSLAFPLGTNPAHSPAHSSPQSSLLRPLLPSNSTRFSPTFLLFILVRAGKREEDMHGQMVSYTSLLFFRYKEKYHTIFRFVSNKNKN